MISSVRDLLWGPEVILAIQDFFGREWLWLFDKLSLLGDIQAIVLVFALTFWLAGPRTGYGLLGAIALAGAATYVISHGLGVPRPDDPRIIAFRTISVPSFPSGHVATATAMYGLLAVWGRIPWLLAASGVAAVSLARLYLGVHYLADILAGIALGAVLIAAYLWWWPRPARWFARRSFRFFAFAGALTVVAVILAFPFLSALAKGWQLLGAAAGAGIAVPIQCRYVRYTPTQAAFTRQAAKSIIGIAGLLMLLVPAAIIGDAHPRIGAALYALLAVWILAAAPALFTRLRF